VKAPSTRTIVIGIATGVWSLNALGGLLIGGYKPSESVNAIYMVIIGWLFARATRRDDDEDPNE